MPSVLVGATSPEQLRENLAAFGPAGALGQDVLAAVEALHLRHRDPCLVD